MERLLRLAPAVLAGFIVEVLVPRAALIAHDHPGGAAPHVHLWAFAAGHHDHHDGDAHRHAHGHRRHRHAVAHDGGHGPTLAALRHVHVPQPYQRVDRPAPVTVVRADRVQVPAPRVAPTPPAGALPVARSRGPPLVAA